MARSITATGAPNSPNSPDQLGLRAFGDGTAGQILAARVQGYSSADLDYRDLAVDTNGKLQLAASVSVDLGTVDQGTAAAATSAWAFRLSDGAAFYTGAKEHVLANDPHATRLTDGTAFYKATTPADTQPVSGAFYQATQPVSGPVTDAQLRASAVPVSGTFWQATQPVSGTVSVGNFPATQPVSGTVAVSNLPASQPVTGPLTDTQLRATAVPVSGTVTASGPLTDTQLRATAVPISGTVTASGPLTDTQLRATAVPVSGTLASSDLVAQGATLASQTGPLAMAVVNDTPNSYVDATINPLTMTPQGRLRVSTTDDDRAWTNSDPWQEASAWGRAEENLYV